MLSKNQLFSLIDQLIVSGANFVTQFLIARYLGPSAYGEFSLVFLAVLFLSNLHRAYFTQPFNILAADITVQQANFYRGSLLCLHAPWVIVGAIAVFSIGILLGIDGEIYFAAIAFFVAYQFHELARRSSLTSEQIGLVLRNDLVTYVLQVSVVALLPWFASPDAASFFLIFATTFFVSTLLWVFDGFIVAFPTADEVRKTLVKHWKFSNWLVFGVFVTWGASQLYPFLLAPYGAIVVGGYAAARNLVNVTNVPIQAVNGYFPSVFVRLINAKKFKELDLLLRKMSAVLFCFSLSLLAVAFSYSQGVVGFVYGTRFGDAEAILPILAIGGAISVLTVRENALLIALGKSRKIFEGNLAGTVFSVTVGLTLVYFFGAVGAAVAGSTALLANFLVQYRGARQAYATTKLGV